MPASVPPRLKAPRLRTVVVILSIVIVVLGTLAVLAAWQMSMVGPHWWRALDADDEQTRSLGEAVEHTIAAEFHRVERPGARLDDGNPDTPDPWHSEPWGIAIAAGEANAWLNTRLRPWLESQDDDFVWPADLAEIQVHFDNSTIHLGVRLERPGRDRVLSATVAPSIDTGGGLWMPATWAYVGRLPIPAGWVLDQSDRRLEELVAERVEEAATARAIAQALKGLEPAADQPTIRLGDGRQVRLLGLRAQRGRLELICRTEFIPRTE